MQKAMISAAGGYALSFWSASRVHWGFDTACVAGNYTISRRRWTV